MIWIKYVAFNWSGFIGNAVYAFFMTPFIIRSLGDTSYGLWNLVAACFGYMALLDFGIQTSVNRYVAKYRGIGDLNGINGIYTNAMALYSCIGFIAVIIGLGLAVNVERLFVIPSGKVLAVRKVMLIMAFYSAFEFPLMVYGSIIYAHQRFDVQNGVSIAMLCLQAASLLIVFKCGGGLFVFSIAIVACGLAKYTLQVVMSHRILPGLSLRMSLISRSTLRTIAKFSVVSFIIMMTSYLILKTDHIVIGMYLLPQAITMYSIGLMLSEYSFEIVNAMSRTFTPAFTDYESRGEHNKIRSLLFMSCRASIAIGVPLVSVAMVVGKDFIRLWLGNGYGDAYTIMVILMFGRALGFASRPMISMIYGIGKHYLGLYTAVFEACSNLILSLILVRKLGVTGVALGTAIPMVVSSVIFPLIVCKGIGIDFRSWLKEGVSRSGLFCACFVSSIWALSWYLSVSTWIELFSEVGAFIAVYIAWAMTIALRRGERENMLKMLTKKLQPLRRGIGRWRDAELE